ncbi:MAG: TonB-dependent receptor [Bacteroidetes bacterium]|nr:TonB-dependent receptor [Bacteroidota bacterium]MBU1115876.1 TonB-dependent receptor [Bacteroidota bacterium]MBU1797990.1 TonB-dependent receptor [Bacteroidota bacterium]
MKLKILVLVLLISNLSFAQTGSLSGKVIDSSTKEALIGANILITELENVGAATDINGNFEFNVPVGSYSIKVSLIGFETVIKTDIIIKTKSQTYIDVQLSPTTLKMDEVTVTADYFDKAVIENNLSTIALGVEEVRRSPGSMSDFQRILQGMAGVSFSNDQTNELLVRGGSPNENLTIFDNMELHSTNHYPNEFNSGGPINMINTELIQDIQFSTGGFISKFGDKMSSAMNIKTRDGITSQPFVGETNISMAGVGATLEGAIDNGNGSWLISARKSYIDLIAKSFGLTAIPIYYDAQFRFMYNLSNKHKLSWSGIYGNDKIKFDGLPDNIYEEKANQIDSVDTQIIDVHQNQWASGISLNSVWSKNLFSVITLYANNYHNEVDFGYSYTERQFDGDGSISDSKVLNSRYIYSNKSDNLETALKAQFGWSISKINRLEFGGQLKFGGYEQSAFIDADTVRFDTNNDGVHETSIIQKAANLTTNLDLLNQNKSYLFVNDKLNFFSDRLILNIGARYDVFTYSNAANVSPRFSASYYLIPLITNINFAYGEYYQTHSYPTYGDRYQTNENQFLKNSHSRHFILGVEHILDDGLKLTVEGFYKKYNNIPVSENFVHQSDPTFRSEKQLNVGKQNVYGIDFMLQQKLVKDLYGTLSFSRTWTEVEDPRIDMEGKSYVSDYDFPYVLNIIIGKRFSDARKTLDKLPAILKYTTYLLPISDDMELSLKWRYASGKPYTEMVYTTSEQHRVGGVTWTKGAWQANENINGMRYPDYHRLDFGFNSRFNFSTWNLVINLSFQNIYNRKNIANYQYNSDGTIDNVYQFSILPVLGLDIEF